MMNVMKDTIDNFKKVIKIEKHKDNKKYLKTIKEIKNNYITSIVSDDTELEYKIDKKFCYTTVCGDMFEVCPIKCKEYLKNNVFDLYDLKEAMKRKNIDYVYLFNKILFMEQ